MEQGREDMKEKLKRNIVNEQKVKISLQYSGSGSAEDVCDRCNGEL